MCSGELLRRHEWETRWQASADPGFLYLCADSSPVGNKDWYVVEEDFLANESAAQLVESSSVIPI